MLRPRHSLLQKLLKRIHSKHRVALRPDQLEQLASALNVSVSDLMGEKEEKKRGSGPTGRMKQLFEQANDLPRSHQQKIAAVLEAFISFSNHSRLKFPYRDPRIV